MQWTRMLSLVDVHTAGEIGSVITGGVLDIPGRTMIDKLDHLNRVDDSLRRFCVFEPRGKLQQSINLLLRPTRAEADAAFIVMQADRAYSMSGSNCMCVVTVLLETGMLAMREPTTRVVLDTPAGLVEAEATCAGGKCLSVALDMVPAFVERLDADIDVPGFGTITADLAFGGMYYGLVDARRVGLAIAPHNARRLMELGNAIMTVLRETVPVRHPELPGLDQFDLVMFTELDEADPRRVRTCTILPGRVDRSPCGTGSNALMAVLHARGLAGPGDRFTMRSIIDSEFAVTLTGTARVGERPAVRARVAGQAWIYGFSQYGRDATDPYPLGFTLNDLWP